MSPTRDNQPCLHSLRSMQTVAFSALQYVEQQLTEGMTEKEAGSLIVDKLAQQGIRRYRYRPVVLFDSRTTFMELEAPFFYGSTNKKLEPNVPIIMDIAPANAELWISAAYSCWFGDESLIHKAIRVKMKACRSLILDYVLEGLSFKEIAAKVDVFFAEERMKTCHHQHPSGFLAKKVIAFEKNEAGEYTFPSSYHCDGGSIYRSVVNWLKKSTGEFFQNDILNYKQLPEPGVWIVEPHAGYAGVGAKWKEMLVITDQGAYWLDDNVPHWSEVEDDDVVSLRSVL